MAYLFHPDALHEIARKYVGVPHDAMVQGVTDDLARAYPGHVETQRQWLFSLAGGCVGVMTVLHASLSEYVLLFGAPVGAGGFSGRYWMDVYDFLLSGELSAFTEKACDQPVFTRPGELALLRQGHVKGFKLTEGSWMLEYGRGVIPASLPFALGDALFSSFDLATIAKTLWIYGRLVVKELCRGKI
jgi:hypothetical protein